MRERAPAHPRVRYLDGRGEELKDFLDRARRRADSALLGISDRAFEEGLARLEAEVAAEEEPRPVVDELDVLVLT